jgi:hypothetical protein
MVNFVKRTTSVNEVGIVNSDSIVTSVAQFLQTANTRTANNSIELTSGKFEQNSLEQNSEFMKKNDDNPLVYGLQNVDRFAMIIAGRSENGTMTFIDPQKPVYSTVHTFKRASHSSAVDIVLQNLNMIEPIKVGLQQRLKYAIEFNNLCIAIAKDAQRGIRVFASYSDAIYTTGSNAIVEWSNNG